MLYLSCTKGMDIFKQNLKMEKLWKQHQLNDTTQIHQLIKQQRRESLNQSLFQAQNASFDNIMKLNLNQPSATELNSNPVSSEQKRQFYQNKNQKSNFTSRFSITSNMKFNQNELIQNDQITTTLFTNTQVNFPLESSPKSYKHAIQGFGQLNQSQEVDSMNFSPQHKKTKVSLFDIQEFGHQNMFNNQNQEKLQQNEVVQNEEHKIINKAGRKSSFQITSQLTLKHKRSDNSELIESNSKLQLISPDSKLQQLSPGINQFGNFSEYLNEKHDKQLSGGIIQLNNSQNNEITYKNNQTSIKEINNQDIKNQNNSIYSRTNDMQIKSKQRLSLYIASKFENEQGEIKNIQQNYAKKYQQALQNNEKLSLQTLPNRNFHQQLSKQSSTPSVPTMNKKSIHLDDQFSQTIYTNLSKQNHTLLSKTTRLSESNFIEPFDNTPKLASMQNQFYSHKKVNLNNVEMVSPLIPIRKPQSSLNMMMPIQLNSQNEQQFRETESCLSSPMKTSVQEYFSNSNTTHSRKSISIHKNLNTQPADMKYLKPNQIQKGIQVIQKICGTPQSISNSPQITFSTPQHSFTQYQNAMFSPQNTFMVQKNLQNFPQMTLSSNNATSNKFFSNKQKIDQQQNYQTQSNFNSNNNPQDANVSQSNALKDLKSQFVRNFYQLTKDKEEIYNTIIKQQNPKQAQSGFLFEVESEKKVSNPKKSRNHPSYHIRQNRISNSLSPGRYQNNSTLPNENRESSPIKVSDDQDNEKNETQTIKIKDKSNQFVQSIKDHVIKHRKTMFHTQQNSIFNQQNNQNTKTSEQQQKNEQTEKESQKKSQKTSEFPLLVNNNSKKKIQIFCHTTRQKQLENDMIQQALQDKLLFSKSPR